MKLPIIRTKRPRDAYKLADAASREALMGEFIAYSMSQEGDRWVVYFKQHLGMKRTKAKKIPIFYDTDAANALLRWLRDQGGNLTGCGTAGARFYTPHAEDAMMMRLAFS